MILVRVSLRILLRRNCTKDDLKAEKSVSGGWQSSYWRKIIKLLLSSFLPNSLPFSNMNKTTFRILILQSKVLNVFAACLGRATRFTKNPHLTCLYCLNILPHLNRLLLSRSYSDFPPTLSSTLIAWIQGNKCSIEICRRLKCCLLAV